MLYTAFDWQENQLQEKTRGSSIVACTILISEKDPPRYPQGAASLVETFFDQTTEEIWDLIVQETNHCYEQKVAAEPNEKRNKMEPCI